MILVAFDVCTVTLPTSSSDGKIIFRSIDFFLRHFNPSIPLFLQLLKEIFNQQPSIWGTDKLPHTVVPAWFQRPGYVCAFLLSFFTRAMHIYILYALRDLGHIHILNQAL